MNRLSIGIGQTRRRGPNFAARFAKNWTKYGKSTPLYEENRNCVRLESKKRVATLRYTPVLPKGVRHRVSVDVFSPIGQETIGVGMLKGTTGAFDAGQGYWKRLSVLLEPGDDIVMAACGFEGKHNAGDWCLFDLSTIKIEADN